MFNPLSIPGLKYWFKPGDWQGLMQPYADCRPKQLTDSLYFDGKNDYLIVKDLQLKKPVTIFLAIGLETHNKKTVLFKTDKQELFLINNRLRYSTGKAVYLDNVGTKGVCCVRDYKKQIVLNYNDLQLREVSLLDTQYDSDMLIGGWDGCKYPLHGGLYHMLIYENAIGDINTNRIIDYLGETL